MQGLRFEWVRQRAQAVSLRGRVVLIPHSSRPEEGGRVMYIRCWEGVCSVSASGSRD